MRWRMNGLPPTDEPAVMSLPMTVPPARGAGITKSPVTGFRRFNSAHRDVRNAGRIRRARALRLGNRLQNRRIEGRERGQDVLLRPGSLDQLQRLRQRRDAAGGRHEPGFGLGALIAAEEEDAVAANRAAEREPAFVPPGLGLVDAVLLVEEVVRVHVLVLEVEHAPSRGTRWCRCA